MTPVSDLPLRILQVALAIAVAVFSVLLISDAQLAGLVGLDQSDLGNAPLVLGRLRLVSRLCLFLLLAVLSAIGFVVVRRALLGRVPDLAAASETGADVVSVESGIATAREVLSGKEGAQTLRLWGYSMGWASMLSLHLHNSPEPRLAVEIFVTDASLIGGLFDDPKATERAAVLRLRVDEWKDLAASGRVRSVKVFTRSTVPHDLGLMIDRRFALLHSYDWDLDGQRLVHHRQAVDQRRFLKLTDQGPAGSCMLDQLAVRFLCRRFDSVESGYGAA